MRRLLLLIALLFAPLPAQAYEASLVFNGCSDEQQNALRQTMDVTDGALTALLQKLDNHALDAYIQAWFGTSSLKSIRSRYQDIRDLLDKPRTLILACEERNCDHDLFGYAEGNSISVCPEFFASPLNDAYDSRPGTLIHEFSHVAAHTIDNAYGPGAARVLAHEHPDKSVNNADTYQYFFESVTYQLPHGTDGWNASNSCEWAYDGECDEPQIGTGSCPRNTDAADCASITPAQRAAIAARKPFYGQRNPKDSCATALNGTCDASCAAGTDYTDCLTGNNSPGQ